MKLWKNTATLDELVPELMSTVDAINCEIAVIGSKPLNVYEMPNLKGIFKCGVGTDNIPFGDAEKLGIKICLPSLETQNIIFEETANFAVYSIIKALYTKVGNLENWKKYQRPFLGNRNVLLIGQGRIGTYVKHKLENLVNVSSYDVLENSPEELVELTKKADVVSLHIPLNEHTKDYWDSEKLGWMKDGSFLVNTSRGPIVNENDLLFEIQNGRIFAIFDVFWKEPYYGVLRKFQPERFVMTPHIASTCNDFLKGLARDFYAFKDKMANSIFNL